MPRCAAREQLAHALRDKLGVGQASGSPRSPGTTTATSSSTTRIAGIGAICHTINPRLFPEQIAYIVGMPRTATCSPTRCSCRWWSGWRRS